MVFNIILFFPLAHVGLALATTISALLNATLLFIALFKSKVFIPDGRWKAWFAKLVVGNLALFGFIKYQMADILTWQNWETVERIENMLILVVLSVAIYVAAMSLLGVRGRDLKHG